MHAVDVWLFGRIVNGKLCVCECPHDLALSFWAWF